MCIAFNYISIFPLPATFKTASALLKFVVTKQDNVVLSSFSCKPFIVTAVELTATTVVPLFSTPWTLKRNIPRLESGFAALLKILSKLELLVFHWSAPPIVLQVNLACLPGQTDTKPLGESVTKKR